MNTESNAIRAARREVLQKAVKVHARLKRENTQMREALLDAAIRFRHATVEWEDAALDCERAGRTPKPI